LLTDQGLRDAMGKAGRQRVKELYDYRTVARRFVEIVESKLGLK